MSETDLQQTCVKHTGARGPFVCGRCQQRFCVQCCYSMPDGSILCHDCYGQPAAAAPAVAAAEPAAAAGGPLRINVTVAKPAQGFQETALPGQGCLQHPSVTAYFKCDFCGAKSCGTCDFFFPPTTHACPQCASASSGNLSPVRKKNMIGALISGGIATVVMVIFFSGILREVSSAASAVLAEVLFRLILFPAAIGAGLALAAFKKGRSNPIGVWLAMIWNFLLMIGTFGLSIVGLFMGGE